MPSPVVELGHSQVTDTSSNTSRTINAPSNAANNTVLLCCVLDGNGGGVASSGFTAIVDNVDIISTDNTAVLAVFHKDEGASPPSTYTITNSSGERMVALAIPISGATGVDSVTDTDEGDSGTASCPSVTPNEDGTLALAIVGTDGTSLSHGTPTGWTLIDQIEQSSAGTLSVFWKEVGVAVATGAASVSLGSTQEWVGATIVLLGDGTVGGGVAPLPYLMQV